jgi:replicative DNA helicase
MLAGLCLLHKILIDKDIEALSRIPEDQLTEEEYYEYNRIRKFLKKYKSLPPPRTAPEGYQDYPIEWWLEVIYERTIQNVILEFKEMPFDNPSQDLIKLYKRLTKLLSEGNKEHIIKPDEIVGRVKSIIQEVRKKKLVGTMGYPTGYPIIDNLTGGYLPTDIFVYVARTKMGKTMYMLNSMNKLLDTVPCMFVSLEMGERQILMRLLGLRFKSNVFTDQKRIISSFVEKKLEKLKLNLYYVNGAGLKNLLELYSLIKVYEPAVVFVDGAYLLKYGQKFNSEWEKAKAIVEELKQIAMRTSTSIVCSYQLNRSASSAKEPDLQHIALSDAIGQIASVVVAVTPDSTGVSRVMHLIANREGISDVRIPVHWDWINMNFDQIEMTSGSEEKEGLMEEFEDLLEEPYD